MIDLHYWPTPNGWKVSIMLEECGLPYQLMPVDIGGGDQFAAEFLRISPNNRMPAIVDHEPIGGGEPISIFESGAILEYLAEKSGQFLPSDARSRYAVLQWVHWQMANLGPMMGNANHFKNYGKNIADDPAQLEYGTKRFVGEVDRLSGVMDAQLSVNEYLAGADYSIADMVTWPWAFLIGRLIDESMWEKFPHLKRWVDLIHERPAVQSGRRIGADLGQRELTEEEEKARRELLFNQTNDKVRAAREAAAKGKRMIDLNREGDVFVLRMDAGENRWNTSFVRAFDAALDEVTQSEGPAALVTTSANEKFFSNGLDLEWVQSSGDHPGGDRKIFGLEFMTLMARIMTLEIPTVCAVNGHGFGAGFMAALCHDERVMRADRGFLCANEIAIGMTIPEPELALFRHKMPADAFAQSVLLARRWTGGDALSAGIVQETAPFESVEQRAIARAAALAPLGANRENMRWMKEAVYGEDAAINGKDGAAFMLRHPEKYRARP